MSVGESALTVRPRMPTAPGFPVPPGACDAHTHVFGPLDAYPSGPSTYPIPLAAPAVHGQALDRMGVDRAVIVQPAPHGTDTGALENALRLGRGRLAGVAAASASVTDATLDRLHLLGVRALRFNERTDPRSGRPYRGAIGSEVLTELIPRLRERGWHAQIWADLEDCVRLADEFAGSGVPLVFDHLAQARTDRGIDDPDFRQLLSRVRDGGVWVKLTLCRVATAPGYRDAQPHHEALLDANPDHMLWGSDWPYVGMGERAPDAGSLLGVFGDWTADTELVRRVLVTNPARLFEFDQAPNSLEEQ